MRRRGDPQKDVKSTKNMTNGLYAKDEKYAEDKIIEKLMKKGFESLTLEELAVTVISPTFESQYSIQSGEVWSSELKSKATERLNFAKFNIKWNTQTFSSSDLIFSLVEKGDISRVSEYFRKNSQYMENILCIVDKSKKSLLHVAAKCGHTNLVSNLITRGLSVNMRDKFLRTPLHLAALGSHSTVVDILIKNKSEVYDRDSIGRTVLHYAACANSVESLVVILGVEPELVHAKDTYGRTSLHYVIWNSNFNQILIANKLIECKAEVDSLDDECMTPLHYASDAGKGKVIPLLLRCGANPFLRDGRTGRTAVELALNQNIREIIIVYSGKPYNISQEDLGRLKIEGEKMESDPTPKRESSNSKPKKNLKEIKETPEEEAMSSSLINELLFKSQKDKLVKYLKSIQEYGVKTMVHLTKPSLYSGSWLENVNSIEDLCHQVCEVTQTEAVMKVFNVISPFSQTFPQGRGDENNIALFYNAKQNETNMKEGSPSVFGIDKTDTNNEEIKLLKEEVEGLKRSIQEENQNSYSQELKNQILKYEADNLKLKEENERLNKLNQNNLIAMNTQELSIEEYKRKMQEGNNVIKSLDLKVQAMQSTIDTLREKEKLAKVKPDKTKQTAIGLDSSFTNGNSVDLSLEEEKLIYLFLKRIEDSASTFENLLVDADKDYDLHIFKHEMLSLLQKHCQSVEERQAVLKLSGFNEHRIKMPIKEIGNNFFKREERKFSRLNRILFNIAYILHNNYIEVERVYDLIKSEKDTFDKLQLVNCIDSLKLNLDNSDIEYLFSNEDKNILIKEFIENLSVRKCILDEVGNFERKFKFEIKNKETENIETTNNEEIEINNIEVTESEEMNNEIIEGSISENNLTSEVFQDISEKEEEDSKSKIVDSDLVVTKTAVKHKKKVDTKSAINGELKIQVKGVENLILPSSVTKPYTLFLTGSLKGVDIETDSKKVVVDSGRKVDFNWATRIVIKNTDLTSIGSLFKVELKLMNKVPVVLGECMINWTSTLLQSNVDSYAIDDKFGLLSKRMSNIGVIAIAAKFIPFGSQNSLFDIKGRRKEVPIRVVSEEVN